MQRHEEVDADGKSELSIFGHPNLLYLPSELSGEMLYNHVDRVVPVLANYTIVLTDGQVKSQSLCNYLIWLAFLFDPVLANTPFTLQVLYPAVIGLDKTPLSFN